MKKLFISLVMASFAHFGFAAEGDLQSEHEGRTLKAVKNYFALTTVSTDFEAAVEGIRTDTHNIAVTVASVRDHLVAAKALAKIVVLNIENENNQRHAAHSCQGRILYSRLSLATFKLSLLNSGQLTPERIEALDKIAEKITTMIEQPLPQH